jgi:hypothetical protein
MMLVIRKLFHYPAHGRRQNRAWAKITRLADERVFKVIYWFIKTQVIGFLGSQLGKQGGWHTAIFWDS